jgi:hypothetical protein
MGFEIITNLLDKIPVIVGFARNLIMKILSVLGLPSDSTYAFVILVCAFILAYFWIKQWTTVSIFKLSILLNLILITLLIYLVFVYI